MGWRDEHERQDIKSQVEVLWFSNNTMRNAINVGSKGILWNYTGGGIHNRV